jgi:hypothetical protein
MRRRLIRLSTIGFATVLLRAIASPDSVAAQTPTLTAEQRRAPCAALVTAEEIRALGRKDVLVQVTQDRAGSSICGWQTSPPNGEAGFIVTLQTAAWFAYEQVANAKESYDLKRHGYDSAVGTDPVPGLGLEARMTRHPQLAVVLVRRANDVIYVTCTDCSKAQSIALAKAAATP